MHIDQIFGEAIKITDHAELAKYLDDACADKPVHRVPMSCSWKA